MLGDLKNDLGKLFKCRNLNNLIEKTAVWGHKQGHPMSQHWVWPGGLTSNSIHTATGEKPGLYYLTVRCAELDKNIIYVKAKLPWGFCFQNTRKQKHKLIIQQVIRKSIYNWGDSTWRWQGEGGIKKGPNHVADWQLPAMAVCLGVLLQQLFIALKARLLPLRSQTLGRRSPGSEGPRSEREIRWNLWMSMILLPAERWSPGVSEKQNSRDLNRKTDRQPRNTRRSWHWGLLVELNKHFNLFFN